jgi:hypothetical protein
MNRVELNRIFLNATSLNRVGSRRGASVAERWEEFLASGVDVLRISNAKANSISSLVVGGGCSQTGTPTPTAPQTIVSNKGAVSYGVLGNNLLEVTDENIVVGKYINNNGEVTTSLPNLYFQRFVAVKASTAYTLSASETLNYANFMEYDANGGFIKRTLYGSSSTAAGKVVTHTMGASTAFVIVGSNINATKYPEVTKDNVKGIKWMFCEGSSAKTYEAYRAGYSYGGQDTISIEGGSSATASLLLGVGTYADAQDIIKGNITRKVGIKALDGFEDITKSSGVYLIDLGDKKATNDNVLCSHFAFIKKTSVSSHTNNLTISSMSNSKVSIRYNAIADEEAFRQFLQREYAKGTPVIVVYPLATEKAETATPVAVSNPKGEVTIVRDAEVKALAMEAIIKVKSEGGGEIEFTIVDYNGEDRTFKAREGMTWEEFLNSEYNTEEWYYDGWGILLYSTEEQWMASNYYLYYGGYVQATDTITSNHPYYISA